MTHYYLHPTDESAKKLFSQPMEQPMVMLNLLRFKEVADYSSNSALAPQSPISGREAYQRYIEQMLPLLRASGGEVLFLGDASGFFIGPQEEVWDMVMLVRQHSLASFLAFARDPESLKIAGHREAALIDSRLLPIKALPML